MAGVTNDTTGHGTNVSRVTSRNSQLTLAERASRRASIASAVGSIQKFKESWISVMFLKATVGLGQVSPSLVISAEVVHPVLII